ncbi:MAG: AAA family ATPase [Leptolyngbya sp. SIO1E4]|nr:AAA family ATPase [Leptolyngbya sp. SIO1E4]
MSSVNHSSSENLKSYLKKFQVALDDEITVLRKSGGQRTYLTDGQYLSRRSNGHYLYAFTADSEIRFQDETPIELEVKSRQEVIKGTLVSVESFDVTLALKEKIGEKVPAATLNTSPIFLLEALQAHFKTVFEADVSVNQDLAELLVTPNSLPEQDVTGSASELLPDLERRFDIQILRNSSQEAAVEQVLSHKVSFIWGPPGTGKTTTLGMTVAALTMAGESVLVLSHSNMAVDSAMLSVAKYLSKSPSYNEGFILRHGVPIPKMLDDYPMLRAKKVLERVEPEFIEEINSLKQQKRDHYKRLRHQKKLITKNTPEYHKKQIKEQITAITKQIKFVEEQLKPLEESRKAKERQLVMRAEVVGCTLSKAAIAEEILPNKYDTVIVDEASMVSIPQCVFAALLAKRRIAIYGDFRQLGSIAKADTPAADKWLKRDIFDQSGVMTRVNRQEDDPRMVMLQTQYRMYPVIADIPNRLCYDGRLLNGPNIEIDNQPTVQQTPFSGDALVLQDISRLRAHCIKETESHSRFNIFSALIAVNVAYQATVDNLRVQVGVIAPYNAQSRLIHRMLRDLEKDEQVKASTVHRFQGSERSVIIFDAVDSDPNATIGLPLQGGEYSGAMRLANVAISRAQGKFIGVMNVRYIRRRLTSAQFQAFRKFIEYLYNSAQKDESIYPLDWAAFTESVNLPGVTCFANAAAAREALEASLLAAQDHVAIYWPCSMFSDHFDPNILKIINQQGVGFYIAGSQGAEAGLALENTQVWNNELTTTSGFVGVSEQCLWIFPDPTNQEAGVLKLELKKTVNLLYGFLRLIPHRKTLPPDPNPFGQCNCKQPLWITSIGNAHLVACLKYPRHPDHDRRRIKPDDATILAELTKRLCGKCGSKLQGRRAPGKDQMILVCSSQECDWMMPLSHLV